MMGDQGAELDAALDKVIGAARDHLAAVRSAGGRVDDDDVWRAYVALNNASFEYDELMLDVFSEVTPWAVDGPINPDDADQLTEGGLGHAGNDPHPRVISLRQRRDYRVPSVSALIKAAESARRGLLDPDLTETDEQITTVGEAVLELLQSGDGSLSALDIPQLDPLDGLVTVTEVDAPLDLGAFDEEDGVGPFQPGQNDSLVGRLDEHPYLDDED
jgi:hypothetical protein